MIHTSWEEIIAVVFGIASVWLSKKENILVYPVGLINTLAYIYLSVKQHLFGEASVNIYYTIMSVYGWVIWSKKDQHHAPVVHISKSDNREWVQHILFFAVFYIVIYFSLQYLKRQFASGALPAADAFASATAFTGMWLMAKKKLESWYWWAATNAASIPLYYVKGLAFSGLYYIVLLILSFAGLAEWSKKIRKAS